jgi:hypothetical protein
MLFWPLDINLPYQSAGKNAQDILGKRRFETSTHLSFMTFPMVATIDAGRLCGYHAYGILNRRLARGEACLLEGYSGQTVARKASVNFRWSLCPNCALASL